MEEKKRLKDELYNRWMSPDGLVNLHAGGSEDPFPPATARTADNQNPILWYVGVLWLCEDELDDRDRLHFRDSLRRLAGNAPGIFYRRPHNYDDHNSHDNLIAMCSGAILTGHQNEVKAIIKHLDHHAHVWNTKDPNNVSPIVKGHGDRTSRVFIPPNVACLVRASSGGSLYLPEIQAVVAGNRLQLQTSPKKDWNGYFLQWLILKGLVASTGGDGASGSQFCRELKAIETELAKSGKGAMLDGFRPEEHPLRRLSLIHEFKQYPCYETTPLPIPNPKEAVEKAKRAAEGIRRAKEEADRRARELARKAREKAKKIVESIPKPKPPWKW